MNVSPVVPSPISAPRALCHVATPGGCVVYLTRRPHPLPHPLPHCAPPLRSRAMHASSMQLRPVEHHEQPAGLVPARKPQSLHGRVGQNRQERQETPCVCFDFGLVLNNHLNHLIQISVEKTPKTNTLQCPTQTLPLRGGGNPQNKHTSRWQRSSPTRPEFSSSPWPASCTLSLA